MERKSAARKTTRKKSAATAGTTPRKTASRTTKKQATAPPRQPCRAIFIDVENTSSEADLLKILDHLAIDRTAQATELTAVGNWKSVGARVARMLAGLGAHLVHSAPAVGVRDWSDLWIAVAAGRWLAIAKPGDMLEIVSDDRAFDAAGDAAAAAGVVFRRFSYRAMPGAAHSITAAPEATPGRRRRRGRGRRGHRPLEGGALVATSAPESATTQSSSPVLPPQQISPDEEAHAASHEQIQAALARLAAGTARWINLDALANALKAEGFTRPPGSPRLITRLRRMKDVEVTPAGMVRLLSGGAPADSATPTPAQTPRRRSRRRGGRGRRRSAPSTNATPEGPAEHLPEDR
jgi:hypothetical protein